VSQVKTGVQQCSAGYADFVVVDLHIGILHTLAHHMHASTKGCFLTLALPAW
jgi:hypothetical protein